MTLKKIYSMTENGLAIVKYMMPEASENQLKKQSTKKYGDVWYVLGADNKWYSPIDAWMISHSKQPGNKEEFKEALAEIANTFGLEKDLEKKEKKEGADSILEEKQLNELASKFLRIGGKWYYKAIHPQTKQETLFDCNAVSVISDYGKVTGGMILQIAKKYIARVNVPSHLDYKESIDNGNGDLFYNIYRPISYIPCEGEWPHIEQLLRHIFQEQFEMALDYLKLLYEQPLQALPILLLVSSENGTGKSAFCRFLQALFCDNALSLTPEIISSRFNSFWVGKLIGYVEEQTEDSMEQKKQKAKIKNIATAENLPMEAKNKDAKLEQNFLKVVICSNDECTPANIDANDTRYWVRKVPVLSKKDSADDIVPHCVVEIPAFLHFLIKRPMRYERKNRLWFDPRDFQTDAWRKIVAYNQPVLEKELREILLDILQETKREVLMYDLPTLIELCDKLRLAQRMKCAITRIDIRQLMHEWGFEASKKTVRFSYYMREKEGGTLYCLEKTGKVYKISKKKICNVFLWGN